MNALNRLSSKTQTITLFEYEAIPYEVLGVEPDSEVLGELEKLNASSGEDLVKLERKQLRATRFVGVMRTRSLTLQVLPKIDHDGSPEAGGEALKRAERSAAGNLLRMLSYTRDLKVREQDVASLVSQPSDWLELLTRLFARDLHALMRRGMSRAYVRVEETLPVMKGRWNIARQLARKPHIKHLFDVAYDEFSVDTVLNRVFKFVVERLIVRTRDVPTRRLLRDLHDWMLDVSHVSRISGDELDHAEASISRLNEQYRVPFNLARMFLENETFRLLAGSRDAYALVFDMEKLFEEFVARFVKRHRDEVLPAGWVNAQIEAQSKERTVYLGKRVSDGKDHFRLIPDLLLRSTHSDTLLVADTKYKKLTVGGKQNVLSDDVYQMLAYAMRFECPRVLLLYPQQRGQAPERLEYEIYGTRCRIVVATIDLHRPLDVTTEIAAELREIFITASSGTRGGDGIWLG